MRNEVASCLVAWLGGAVVHMLRPRFPWSMSWEQMDEEAFASSAELRRMYSLLPSNMIPVADALYRLSASLLWPVKRVQWAIQDARKKPQ